MTRYAAENESTWWVTYGLLTNTCSADVYVTRVQAHSVPTAATTQLTGRFQVIAPAPTKGPLTALTQGGLPTQQPTVTDQVIAPGGSGVLSAEVRLSRSTEPQVSPDLQVTYHVVGLRTASVIARVSTRICTCAMPSGS